MGQHLVSQRTALALLLLTLTAVPAAAQAPTLTEDEQRDFLLKAPIVSSRPAGKGITGSLRLTLDDGRVKHDAGFQSIDERASMEDRRQGRRRAGELNFVDSYKYNIAAYQLARVLGLSAMMPVTVERRWNGKTGSLTWWVDDFLMDEQEREKQNAQGPSALNLQRQRQRMFIFAELIRDTDRNKGNILYTKDWRVIMIDFSRAFRLEHELRRPESVQQCDRNLYEKLKTLTLPEIRAAVGEYLTQQEATAIMHRRKLIVDRLDKLIAERGERAILY